MGNVYIIHPVPCNDMSALIPWLLIKRASLCQCCSCSSFSRPGISVAPTDYFIYINNGEANFPNRIVDLEFMDFFTFYLSNSLMQRKPNCLFQSKALSLSKKHFFPLNCNKSLCAGRHTSHSVKWRRRVHSVNRTCDLVKSPSSSVNGYTRV